MGQKRFAALAPTLSLKRAVAPVQLKTQACPPRRSPTSNVFPASAASRQTPCMAKRVLESTTLEKQGGAEKPASDSASESGAKSAHDFQDVNRRLATGKRRRARRRKYLPKRWRTTAQDRASWNSTRCDRRRGAFSTKPRRCWRTGLEMRNADRRRARGRLRALLLSWRPAPPGRRWPGDLRNQVWRAWPSFF